MTAYLREVHHCEFAVCRRRVTHEVFSTQNASFGKFCAKHAKWRLQSLQKAEDTIASRRRAA
jgi:hypothetical protein